MKTVKPLRKKMVKLLKKRQDLSTLKTLKTYELEKELCKYMASIGYGKGAVLKNLEVPTKEDIKDGYEPWKTLTVISYHLYQDNDIQIWISVYCKLKYKKYTEKSGPTITTVGVTFTKQSEWFFEEHELIKPSKKFKGLFTNQDSIDNPRIFGKITEESA